MSFLARGNALGSRYKRQYRARQGDERELGCRTASGAADRSPLNYEWAIFGGRRVISHDGHLVQRAAPAQARPYSAEVGVLEPSIATQGMAAVGLSHQTANFLSQPPSDPVADAELPCQCERGSSCLVLTHEVEREQRYVRRRLGTVEHARIGQRCLVSVSVARHRRAVGLYRGDLVQLKIAVLPPAKSSRPPHLRRNSGALFF